MKKFLLPLLGLLFVINGCASMSASEKRKQLDLMAGGTISSLLIQYPGLLSELEEAPGYLIAHLNAPPSSGGEGVLIDSTSGEQVYFTIGGVEIGSGWGTRSFKILLVLRTQAMLDSFKTGNPVSQSVHALGEEPVSTQNNEYTVYIMSDSGVAVTTTVKIIDFKINSGLAKG